MEGGIIRSNLYRSIVMCHHVKLIGMNKKQDVIGLTIFFSINQNFKALIDQSQLVVC